MQKRLATMAAFGVAIGIVLVSSVGAASEDKRTAHITFSQPVGLPGVVLPAGTYVFEVADPLLSMDIIRVTNRKRSMVYFTAFTERVERLPGVRGEAGIVLAPPEAGNVRKIAAWHPRGESIGHEFIYR